MADGKEEIRQANMLKLKAQFGSYTEMARKTGKNYTYFSHIGIGTRQMSGAYAREIERLLGLEEGWLDVPH